MIDGIYGVQLNVDRRKYTIRWRDQWYHYIIDEKDKTTTFRYAGIRSKTIIKLPSIVPLNELNFEKTIDRFEKLLLLK